MKSVLLPILIALSFNTLAQDRYICTKGNAERIIEVVYKSPQSKVPCEVKYSKSDKARVLWSANNEIGFCESKAKDFANKLSGFGWSCPAVIQDPPEVDIKK